jgi:hypothetical protein
MSEPALEWTSASRLQPGDRLLVSATPARLASIVDIDRSPDAVNVSFASGNTLTLHRDHELLRARRT